MGLYDRNSNRSFSFADGSAKHFVDGPAECSWRTNIENSLRSSCTKLIPKNDSVVSVSV